MLSQQGELAKIYNQQRRERKYQKQKAEKERDKERKKEKSIYGYEGKK